MNIILSVVMLAVLVLLYGAWRLWARGVRKQAVLMVILALVGLANVAIWTLPDDTGNAPISKLPE